MWVVWLALLPFVATPGSDSVRNDGLIELEDIYSTDSERRVDFSASVPRIEWLDPDSWLERRKCDDGKRRYLRVNARTGEAEPFFDHELLEKAMMAVPGVGEEDARAVAFGRLLFDAERTAGLFHHGEDLFAYRLGEDRVIRLTHDPIEEVGEEWSPDGRMVSFVRGHDLYLYDFESGRERRLTNDGSEELLYGRLDWVYQEELYGRGNFKGYWWSPDSRTIALLRLDESDVKEFTVVDHLPLQLDTEVTNYPKAGAPNPKVTLGVIPASGGEIRWVDTTAYEPIEHLIVRVGWKPDSSEDRLSGPRPRAALAGPQHRRPRDRQGRAPVPRRVARFCRSHRRAGVARGWGFSVALGENRLHALLPLRGRQGPWQGAD